MNNRYQISIAQSHETVAQHTDFTWFTSRGESYIHKNYFYYILREYTVPLQPIMQLEIFWETLRTQLGALLS